MCIEVVLIVVVILVCFVCGGCLLCLCFALYLKNHQRTDHTKGAGESAAEEEAQLTPRRVRDLLRLGGQEHDNAPPYDPRPRSQSVGVSSSSSIIDSLDTDTESHEASEHSIAISVEDSMERSIELSKNVPSERDARHERSSECEIEKMRRKGRVRRSVASRHRRSKYRDDDHVRVADFMKSSATVAGMFQTSSCPLIACSVVHWCRIALIAYTSESVLVTSKVKKLRLFWRCR